jgi:hypothetical protein
VKDIAICSARGNWAVLGKLDGKKAMLTLKHSEKGNMAISEKDLKPIIDILAAVETRMKDERKAKEAGK